MISFLIIAAGLTGLVIGSGWAVKGARALAKRAGISPMVIGLTVLSIGTSLPEIATNVAVGWKLSQGGSSSGIAVSNIVGSCLSQITLLIGVTALIGTMTCRRRVLWIDGSMVLAAAICMWLVCRDGTTATGEAILLISLYITYVSVAIWRGKRDESADPPTENDESDNHATPLSLRKAVGLVIIGLALVTFSADQVVRHGIELARNVGISESFIGIWIGVGTGLPELTVAVRAIRVSSGTMSLGNLLGSNITDPLLSFGSGALVHEMNIGSAVLRLDFPFWIGATVIMLLIAHLGLKIDRVRGAILVGLFLLFILVRLWRPEITIT